MEGLIGIAVVALLAAPVLTLAALAKLGSLSRELEEVKKMLKVEHVKDYMSMEKGEAASRRLSEKRSVAKIPVPSGKRTVVSVTSGEDAASPLRVAKPVETVASYTPPPYEPTAADRFWATVEDWFCVRGRFAPKGMTREFAVATRWLLRGGSLLLVGAMAYFITLAINRGWIGPTQRVFGMMFWGVVGTVGGTWLKVKSERYSILGEVFAALGLVATYLSFGLGHRYFDPPVIGSVVVAFAGLVVATVAAGVLSVRLKSLTIAVLGLLGGFLVPTICSFSHDYNELVTYLTVLTVGAAVVAYLRQWTALGFVAIAVAFGFAAGGQKDMVWTPFVSVAYNSCEYALVLALTLAGLKRRTKDANAYCWVFVTVAAIATTIASTVCLAWHWSVLVKWYLLFVAAVHAVLAWQSRKREWGCTPVMIVLSMLSAVGVLCECCEDWNLWRSYGMLVFCAFAAILAELSARTKERTLEELSLVVTAGCVIGWIVLAGKNYEQMSVYWTGLANRSLELWSLPALFAFHGVRIAARGTRMENTRMSFFVGAAILAFILVTAESKWFGDLVLPSVGGGCITIVWATIAASLLTAGIVRRWKAIRLTGLGLLGLSVFKVLFIDTASLATPARVAVFAAVGVLMVAGAFLYLKFRSLFESQEGTEPSR